MEQIKLKTTIPNTIKEKVAVERLSQTAQNLTPIQRLRAKQKEHEVRELYNRYYKEMNEYVDKLNLLNTNTGYDSYFEVIPEEEYISEIQKRDYSNDEPFMLMRTNPEELKSRYESGELAEYFKSNPYAREEIEKWYIENVIHKEKRDVENLFEPIKLKSRELHLISGIGYDTDSLIENYKAVNLEQERINLERQKNIEDIRNKEREYYLSEQERLNNLWSNFNKAFESLSLEGDYVERNEKLNEFANTNRDLILGSIKNYRRFNELYETISEPNKYAKSFIDNTNYELVYENDKKIIRKKPESYVKEYEYERWQEEETTKSGAIRYKTKTSEEYDYGQYYNHILILNQDDSLLEELFYSPYIKTSYKEPNYQWKKGDILKTKELKFEDNKLLSRSTYDIYTNKEYSDIYYEWSGKLRKGTAVYSESKPYQKTYVNYKEQYGWNMPTIRGEITRIYVPKPDIKPQEIKKQDILIQPSNLFGTSKNILRQGEYELKPVNKYVLLNKGLPELYNTKSQANNIVQVKVQSNNRQQRTFKDFVAVQQFKNYRTKNKLNVFMFPNINLTS